MDRISKALELAKQRRTKRPGTQQLETEQYRYTQTKTIEISPAQLRKNRVVSTFLNDPIADSYRLLRARVLRRMRQNNWNTIGVTSAGQGDGKTLTAVNLGVSIANEPNHTVLLVDADLRRPSVHKVFDVNPEHGLDDYLISEIPIEQLLINPGLDNFVILPCQTGVTASSELLSAPKMAQLVQELKTRYPSRLVIFDLPPVLVGDDVVAFSSLLDAVLLVVSDGKTRSDELVRSLELLEHVDLIGAVLNKSKEADRAYDYYY